VKSQNAAGFKPFASELIAQYYATGTVADEYVDVDCAETISLYIREVIDGNLLESTHLQRSSGCDPCIMCICIYWGRQDENRPKEPSSCRNWQY
jgi:hypothetical protein